MLSDVPGLRLEVTFGGADAVRPPLEIVASEFVAVKSFKAKGKRLTTFVIDHITELEPIAVQQIDDSDVAEESDGDFKEETTPESVEDEKSDDEIRDELTGQQRLF